MRSYVFRNSLSLAQEMQGGGEVKTGDGSDSSESGGRDLVTGIVPPSGHKGFQIGRAHV